MEPGAALEISKHRSNIAREVGVALAWHGQRKDDLSHLVGSLDGQLAYLDDLLVRRALGDTRLKQSVEPDADGKNPLLDTVVERSGDAVPLTGKQLGPLDVSEALVQPAQFCDRLALALVQPSIVYSHGHIIGKG